MQSPYTLTESLAHQTRRHFLSRCGMGLGSMALASMARSEDSNPLVGAGSNNALSSKLSHHVAKAKQVIYLFMAGGPSQLELLDYKPVLQQYNGKAIPDSYLEGKRFAFMDSSFKNRSTLLGTRRTFQQHGQCGMWISDLLPHTAGIVDECTFLRTCQTNLFNHAPAKLFMNTGSGQFGRPSMGAWANYGLGTSCQDLPGFVVLQSGPRGPRGGRRGRDLGALRAAGPGGVESGPIRLGPAATSAAGSALGRGGSEDRSTAGAPCGVGEFRPAVLAPGGSGSASPGPPAEARSGGRVDRRRRFAVARRRRKP